MPSTWRTRPISPLAPGEPSDRSRLASSDRRRPFRSSSWRPLPPRAGAPPRASRASEASRRGRGSPRSARVAIACGKAPGCRSPPPHSRARGTASPRRVGLPRADRPPEIGQPVGARLADGDTRSLRRQEAAGGARQSSRRPPPEPGSSRSPDGPPHPPRGCAPVARCIGSQEDHRAHQLVRLSHPLHWHALAETPNKLRAYARAPADAGTPPEGDAVNANSIARPICRQMAGELDQRSLRCVVVGRAAGLEALIHLRIARHQANMLATLMMLPHLRGASAWPPRCAAINCPVTPTASDRAKSSPVAVSSRASGPL